MAHCDSVKAVPLLSFRTYFVIVSIGAPFAYLSGECLRKYVVVYVHGFCEIRL